MLAVKRKVIEAALVIVFFLLETTIFSYLELASIKPNLLIILTAAFGFMQGKKEGMFVGVLSGFLLDISFGQYIGFYILLYTVIGYANGFFQKLYYDENIKLPLLLIGGSELVYGILVYFFQFMLQSDFHVIIPEMLYTVIITLIVYQLILRINRKLVEEEKRSASRFV